MPGEIRLRPATPDDDAFLGEMLAEAAAWSRSPDEPPPTLEDLLEWGHTAEYIAGWGRDGDEGVIAEVDGVPAGACWYRRFSADHPCYGFLGPDVPGISLAVRREQRRRGVGQMLLEALIEVARERGVATLSISVEAGNHRARRLYDRAGFVFVAPEEGSFTLRLDL